MSFCGSCGTALGVGARFCSSCGAPATMQNFPPAYTAATAKNGNIMDKVNDTIGQLTGESRREKIKLSDLFSDIFKRHSPEETDRIFIRGTSATTPFLGTLNIGWQKPWLYSRVFLILFLSFVILFFCTSQLNNIYTLPGVIFLGSFMIPLSLTVLFYEINVPQNISFIKMVKIFLIGGCASMLLTLLIFAVFPVGDLDYGGAIAVGIIEELGKLLIVAFFIYKERNTDYLLNGLLIGAAIGAGFAAFESAGYALANFLDSGYNTMIEVIYLRGFLAPGGHIVWAAISGFALMKSKGNQTLSIKHFGSSAFWKLIWIPVVFHSIWDMPIRFGSRIYFVNILLTVGSWVVIMVLISVGLSQVNSKIAAFRRMQYATAHGSANGFPQTEQYVPAQQVNTAQSTNTPPQVGMPYDSVNSGGASDT